MGKGLGRGINAFFPDASSSDETQITEIKLKEIRPNPYQPRRHFDEEAMKELADSLNKQGLLQPITVRESIKGYEIVVGERRFRAAQQNGWSVIPAVVKTMDDDQMMELAIIENLQRENLSPLEEAQGYQKLMEHRGLTQQQLADRLGKSRSYLANMLRLLQLPKTAQQYLAEEKISTGHARALLGLKNKQELTPLLQRIVRESMSVRQLEAWIQQANADVSRETKPKTAKPAWVHSRESMLTSYLGTKVQITPGKKRNRIEIDFESEEELERIVSMMYREED
ncbi:ParB/RepB/Spo0J family partition protein [Alkalicoccus chagannorensis]|uniref:ParB/RepB/Spo0J family partition protein n=1 Tax=Alkalicoccus chagannorensis TaxID=427072 RepID=UPI0004283F62|nr:ParB/RepB/Spo0J family partition protein [Alkalicoccus chagannorensis]